ncbi:MAG: Gfo/Idh/MocA family oxidoreductase [Saprospiraceae bacterium]|nr:Gfo/Idh/MocA family oxidoreductase [Saprospiraceae bacterium]
MNDQQVRWGIIGVGDVCEKKSAPAMQLVANSSIEAVMRRNAAKAADYARRHQIDKWYDDADQLINDPRVNAIYIATPPSSHQEYTLRAAQAGKPVYVEKPMALDHAQCLQMIDHCDRHQVPLYVAYYRRALPNFLKVKEIVDQGILGEIRFVRISLFQSARWDLEHPVGNWRVNPQISGGGHFVDLASHQFDFLDFVFGPLEQVWGATENQGGLYPAEDLVSASFRWRSGVVGQGLWCFTAPENAEEETVQIVGSKGKLSFACFGSPNLLLELAGQEPVEMTFAYPQHIQQPLIEQIIADLLGYGEAVSTGITAARTNLVMDRILKTV